MEAQAREATRFYLGDALYDRALRVIREESANWRQAVGQTRSACFMLGIEGRMPFRALLRDVLKGMPK